VKSALKNETKKGQKMEVLYFETAEEGFEALRALYVDSEVTGGEMIDHMFEECEFSGRLTPSVMYEAIQMFRDWDSDEDEKNVIYSDGKSNVYPDGVAISEGTRIGVKDEDGITYDKGIRFSKFNLIYDLLLNTDTFRIDNYVSNDFSVLSPEELEEILEDDPNEDPIILSIYGMGNARDGSFTNFEYYFDYNDICSAKVDGANVKMKDETGRLIDLLILAPINIEEKLQADSNNPSPLFGGNNTEAEETQNVALKA
jgi:hypothetical protein